MIRPLLNHGTLHLRLRNAFAPCHVGVLPKGGIYGKKSEQILLRTTKGPSKHLKVKITAMFT
jgi:hypothetical protein